MTKNNIYEQTQSIQVLKSLIRDHFDNRAYEVRHQQSPRNKVYPFERMWGLKMNRRKVKGVRAEYTEYRIPNVETMKKAIAYFESKAWILSEKEKASAIARTELLERQIAKEKAFKSEKLAQELKELKA